jgi:hypothetical protein
MQTVIYQCKPPADHPDQRLLNAPAAFLSALRKLGYTIIAFEQKADTVRGIDLSKKAEKA